MRIVDLHHWLPSIAAGAPDSYEIYELGELAFWVTVTDYAGAVPADSEALEMADIDTAGDDPTNDHLEGGTPWAL